MLRAMTEAELIKKIQKLRQIKPNSDWVSLTKLEVLGPEESYRTPSAIIGIRNLFSFKPVLAGLITILIVFGVFGLAQNSLPGDLLYPLKKLAERGQAIFVSESARPQLNLELANKRLDELTKVAESNQAQKLAPAINEFEKTKKVAKKSVSEIIKNKPEKEAIKIAKKVAPELQEINKKEKQVYAALNIEPKKGTNESSEKAIVELLIKDAEDSSLTDLQKNDLEKVEEYYKNENYSKALESYLTSSLNK